MSEWVCGYCDYPESSGHKSNCPYWQNNRDLATKFELELDAARWRMARKLRRMDLRDEEYIDQKIAESKS